MDAAEFAARTPAPNTAPPAHDMGRNLFAWSRNLVTPADQGALSISCGPPTPEGGWEYDAEYELGHGYMQRLQRRTKPRTRSFSFSLREKVPEGADKEMHSPL